jgi:hypothetical protein
VIATIQCSASFVFSVMFSSQSSGDDFPLPQIDVLVDNTNTAGHGMLSFMDAFS